MGEPSSSTQDEYQLQRSRNGCLTCRQRRVKCDETRPVCERCRFGRRECGYGPEKAPNPRKRRRKPTLALPSTPAASSSSNNDPVTAVAPVSPITVTTPARPSSSTAFEGNPIEWISDDTRKRLMMDATLLATFFPRVDEMLTFRHYIQTAEELMAFSTPHGPSPFNPWVTIHAPLVLRDAPGISRPCDALRLAVLAVGAVRLRFVEDPTRPRSAIRITSEARHRVLAMLDDVLKDPEKHAPDIEVTLAALLSLTVACTLAADNGWDDVLQTAIGLIDRLGGAHKIVSACPKNQYSVTRFVLEQLAVRDVVACMTLGRRPSIIRQPFEPWFYEIERWSGRDVEWESVERMFGVTRSMVDVMARACSLIGIARETMAVKKEDTSPPRGLHDAANGLLAELQVWDHGFNYYPHHTRTQYGNHCYRHAMRIALMRDVLGLERSDERVVSCAHAILELARELDFEKGITMNWLLWPLLLSGFHLGPDTDAREPLLRLLEHPGPHMCFDTRAGIRLLQEYWAQQDGGVASSHWQVCDGELHRSLFAG